MTKRAHSVQIIRHLKHDRARVFSALTDPVKMAQWFFSMTKHSQAKVTNELRVGGTYRIEMTGPDISSTPQGAYLEIVPPERLVFTWVPCTSDATKAAVGPTKVTIELFEDGPGTKLVLTHELPEDLVAGHREGWTQCFDHLEFYLGHAKQP